MSIVIQQNHIKRFLKISQKIKRNSTRIKKKNSYQMSNFVRDQALQSQATDSVWIKNNFELNFTYIFGETYSLVVIHNILKSLTLILKIPLQGVQLFYTFPFRLLNIDGQFLRIVSKSRQKMFYKIVQNQTTLRSMTLVFYLDPKTGIIRGYTKFRINKKNQFKSFQAFFKVIVKAFSQEIDYLRQIIIKIADITNYSQQVTQKLVYQNNYQKNNQDLFQYVRNCNIQVCLQQENISGNQKMVELLVAQNNSIDQMKKNLISIHSCPGDLILFSCLDSQFLMMQHLKNYQKNEEEKQYLSQVDKNIKQNNNSGHYQSVLSYIKLSSDLNHIKRNAQLVCRGGFSLIFKAMVKYFQSDSTSFEQRHLESHRDKHRQQAETKCLIIKQETGPSHQINRIMHQRQIITHIKNASPTFFPKYYIPIDQDPAFQKILLIQKFNQNLAQFLQKNSEFISLNSKIMIAYNIVHAIRSLKLHNVVHLDLKPQNIMMTSYFRIKILDFGQAYHPKVPSLNRQRGFTVPYSPPQSYTNSPFTPTFKYDLFSFGVILFELITGNLPFQIYSQQRKQKQIWFMCPQQMIARFGEHTVLPSLMQLINRCLSIDTIRRPQLERIILILMTCFKNIQ